MDRVVNEMADFGFSAEQIEATRAKYRAKIVDPTFDIFPQNVPACRLFLALATQWRTESLSSLGGGTWFRIGLDYSVVEFIARTIEVEVDQDCFVRLQILEAEALKAWTQDRTARQ